MTFILFIIIIILLFWISSVSNRVAGLEKKLQNSYAGEPTQERVASAMPSPSEHKTAMPAAKDGQSEVFAIQEAKAEPASAAAASLPKEKESDNMETVFTTSWLNKIGVVALVLGMVFFFKYAIDQGWITPWLRIIIGFLVSGLLIYLGHLWREKYGTRAHSLSGGGFALLYFTIFAGYQFYGLLPQAAAFVLIVTAAVISVWLSFTYSSLTLGILGFFGAYGAPIMLSSGKDQQMQLFVYLTILNSAVLVILLKKYWLELTALALVGTVIDFGIWASSYSTSANTLSSEFFTIITTGLFILGIAGLTHYHNTKNTLPERFDANAGTISVLAGLFYFTASILLLNNSYHSMVPSIMLLGGVLFFFAYALVDRLEFTALNYLLSISASFMLVYASGVQWDGKALALAWLSLGLLGLTVGSLLKREELRTWGVVVLFLSLFKSFVEPYPLSAPEFLFNAKFGLMFASTLSLLYAGWLYGKYPTKVPELKVQSFLEALASIVLWIAVSWDITASFTAAGTVWSAEWVAFWWVVFPCLLAFIAASAGRKYLMNTAVVLIALAFFRVLLLSYGAHQAFLFNPKFGLMFAETLSLLFIARIYGDGKDGKQLSDIFKVGASMLFWFAVSWEIVEYFRLSPSMNARNLLLSMWWIVYAVFLLIAGSIASSSVFRKVAFGLFGLAIVKVFLYDVQALDTPYRVASFIILGVILLSVSFSYEHNKEKIARFLEGDGKV